MLSTRKFARLFLLFPFAIPIDNLQRQYAGTQHVAENSIWLVIRFTYVECGTALTNENRYDRPMVLKVGIAIDCFACFVFGVPVVHDGLGSMFECSKCLNLGVCLISVYTIILWCMSRHGLQIKVGQVQNNNTIQNKIKLSYWYHQQIDCESVLSWHQDSEVH